MKKTEQQPLVADADKFIVRLPEGMRDRIAEAAKENGRSMNAETVSRLAQSFAPRIRDLSEYSVGELVQELLDRFNPDEISIRIGTLDENKK